MRTDGFIGVIFLLAVVVSVVSCAPAETPIDDSTPIASDGEETPALMRLYNHAIEAGGQGDWKTAHDSYLAGIAMAPNSPALILHAAGAAVRLGEVEACREHLESAIRIGATADLATDEAYTDVIHQPEFKDLAQRLPSNGAPRPPAEIVHQFQSAQGK